MKATHTSPVTRKMSFYDKVQMLNKKADKDYLLHYGQYFFKYTIESAAKDYFSVLMKDPKMQAKAVQLGLA